ncbi:MAG: glutamate racemase [bacterium]
MKIGVFDSGIGGLSVVNAIQKELPELEIIFKNDKEHLPYGSKTTDQLFNLSRPILESLVDDGCGVIVIACNSVSTNIIEDLRKVINVPLIAMEPMVKPAAELTKTNTIAVCATPATLASNRYRFLKEEYAKGVKVLEPNCSNWSSMIENNEIDHENIKDLTNRVCEEGADVIVLGCTHYHWIEEEIAQIAQGRAVIIQPEKPVIEQLKRVIEQLN